MVDNYFANIAQFLSTRMAPSDITVAQNKKLVVKETYYQLIAGNLYKLGADGILIQCMSELEREIILSEAHKGIVGGNYTGKATMHNILCAGLWWPTLHKDAKEYREACDVCQRVGKPSRRYDIPLHP
jgi:hypothetical protein